MQDTEKVDHIDAFEDNLNHTIFWPTGGRTYGEAKAALESLRSRSVG
jgi:hypothetical protein